MNRRRVIISVVLVLLVFLGPLAMALQGCAAMGVMCEGTCATSSCAIPASTDSIRPADVAFYSVLVESHIPANTFAGLEHPPRFISRSA